MNKPRWWGGGGGWWLSISGRGITEYVGKAICTLRIGLIRNFRYSGYTQLKFAQVC